VPERDVSVHATIPAPADRVYALVSDVTRMGEFHADGDTTVVTETWTDRRPRGSTSSLG
jgi:uncharacterized protein YndB with AHSA1/START domain